MRSRYLCSERSRIDVQLRRPSDELQRGPGKSLERKVRRPELTRGIDGLDCRRPEAGRYTLILQALKAGGPFPAAPAPRPWPDQTEVRA